MLENPSCLRAKARPFLFELHKLEPKLLSVFLAVFKLVLGVFLLKFLLFMKESLCNRILWFLQFLQGQGFSKTTQCLDARQFSAEYPSVIEKPQCFSQFSSSGLE